MNGRRLTIALLLAVAAAFVGSARASDRFRYTAGKHGKGELRYVNGIPVLLVQGSPEEMGEQVGVLVLKPAAGLLKQRDQILKGEGWNAIYPIVVKTGTLMLSQIPPDHLKELESAARAAAPWRREDLVFGNLFPDLRKLSRCSALMIEPERSATGGPLFGRNLDWFGSFSLHEFTLVTVCRPAGKHAFASIGFCGMFGCFSAINDAGLSLADLEVLSARDGSLKLDLSGVPYTFALRRIMEECATIDEAEALLRSIRRTTMENFAVCDTRRAVVFEVTTKQVVARHAEDAICACTNHFRTKELSTDKQCTRYETLDKSRQMKRLGLADVIEKMDAVANDGTLQTMVFEPAVPRLHLAFGPGPASQRPLRPLELSSLFARGQFPPDRGSAEPPLGPPRITKNSQGLYDVVFRYRPVGRANAVYLAGTFNKWKPAAWKMDGPDKDGFYQRTVSLGAGRHEYKFVTEGKVWHRDPGNDAQAGFYHNSVIDVGR